jgi:flagellar FliL protein
MATSAPKAGAKESSTDTAPPAKRSIIWIIVLVVLIVLCGGAGAWYFLVHNAGGTSAQKSADADFNLPPIFLPLDSFTVNLQAEDGEQFLQTNLTLQVASQEQLELIKLYMPTVRSRLLLLLSSKKGSEILTTNGKTKLSQEIIDVFKQPFVPRGPTVKVMGVLFTSFVVQ